MKLIIGLGNPGEKYEKTRHNIGWRVLDNYAKHINATFSHDKKFDAFIAQVNLLSKKALLVKPTTYMNLSGNAVRKIIDYYKIDIEDIIVIVDDVYLDVGTIRIRESGSHGGQNGLKSIQAHLNTNNYKRIKVGVGLNDSIALDQYLLSNFSKKYEEVIDLLLIDTIQMISMFIEDVYFKDIMTKFNTKYNEKNL